MLIRATKKNIEKHAEALLDKTVLGPLNIEVLVHWCTKPIEKERGVHLSHTVADRLEQINTVLGTHGVEGMILGDDGRDVSGECSDREVAHDIQYCNAGDTYALTILWYRKRDHEGSFYIGDWGSIIESIPSPGEEVE